MRPGGRLGSARKGGKSRPDVHKLNRRVRQDRKGTSYLPGCFNRPSRLAGPGSNALPQQSGAVSRNPRVTVGAQGANEPLEWAWRWPTTGRGVPGSCGPPQCLQTEIDFFIQPTEINITRIHSVSPKGRLRESPTPICLWRANGGAQQSFNPHR
jgi:hypothetical protein